MSGHSDGDTVLSLDDLALAPSGSPPPPTPSDLRWEVSYDRASIDQFVAEVARERGRLMAEIDTARARLRAAEDRAAAASERADAELGALVTAALQELERLERSYEEAVAAIRAAAEAEAARVLDAARAEADAVRSATASMRRLVDRGVDLDGTSTTAASDREPGAEAHVDAG